MIDTAEKFRQQLRGCGMKVTPQRMAILRALCATTEHPDAEHIFAVVRKEHPEMSRATVYSTLRCLRKAGLVREIAAFGEIRRFDGGGESHAHLICCACNRIEDLNGVDCGDFARVATAISKKTQYDFSDGYCNFYGYCPACKKKLKKQAGIISKR